MVRLNADVDDRKAKQLKHLLVDEGISFSEWLRRHIDAAIGALDEIEGAKPGKEEKKEVRKRRKAG